MLKKKEGVIHTWWWEEEDKTEDLEVRFSRKRPKQLLLIHSKN